MKEKGKKPVDICNTPLALPHIRRRKEARRQTDPIFSASGGLLQIGDAFLIDPRSSLLIRKNLTFFQIPP